MLQEERTDHEEEDHSSGTGLVGACFRGGFRGGSQERHE